MPGGIVLIFLRRAGGEVGDQPPDFQGLREAEGCREDDGFLALVGERDPVAEAYQEDPISDETKRRREKVVTL